MDPERPIEKALRACAARGRRAAAGESFELHPASRRLLQGEVARQYGRPATSSRRWIDWVARAWPRVIWATSAAAMLVALGWLLMPSRSGTQPEIQLARNLDAERSAPAKVPAPSLEADSRRNAAPAVGRPADQPVLAERSNADQSVQPAGGLESTLALTQSKGSAAAEEQTARMQPMVKETPAGVPPPEPKPASGLQPGAVATASENEPFRYGLARALTQEVAQNASVSTAPGTNLAVVLSGVPSSLATPAAGSKNELFTGAKDRETLLFSRLETVPALGVLVSTNGNAFTVAADSVSKQKEAGVMQRFVRLRGPTSPSARDSETAADSTFAAFQVEQSGLALRVVDQDGSIYTGYLEITQNQPAAPTLSPSAQARSSPAPMVRLQRSTSTARRLEGPVPQYSFRVTGTNQTLMQPVVFTGTLSHTNAPTITSARPVRIAVQPGLPLNNSQISGKVFIGNQPPVEILATPAK